MMRQVYPCNIGNARAVRMCMYVGCQVVWDIMQFEDLVLYLPEVDGLLDCLFCLCRRIRGLSLLSG